MRTSLLGSFVGVLTLVSTAFSLPPFPFRPTPDLGAGQVHHPVPDNVASTLENYKAYTFVQPRDHFDPSSNATFTQRYWFSARHYKKGGPVVVLDSGEIAGEDRLSFLDTGILDILAAATNGVGVILEHRYYGTFFFYFAFS